MLTQTDKDVPGWPQPKPEFAVGASRQSGGPSAVGAPPSPPSPGAKIDAALASPEAPPPAPPSSPDEPDDEPEDPMLALEYTGP